jgi:predicted TIM-barrel fold metal-dependent hydrolase
MQIVDCHTHALSSGTRDYNRRFLKDLSRPHFRVTGLLPYIEEDVESDWKKLDWLFEAIDPEQAIADHKKAGVERMMILAQAPSEYTQYGGRGTIDLAGVTDVGGEMAISKNNDYIAGLTRKYPDQFIGFGAVNPRFRGVGPAVIELERMITDLKLTGLKLYPMYDYYSPDDCELAFPIFAKAQEMGIPVTVHMGTSTARYTNLDYAHPVLLDIVGQKFPKLKLIMAHGGIPWLDEGISVVARHPNFYIDLSYTCVILSREELFRYLDRCKRWGVPLSRICWGTDYPLHETVETILGRFLTLNEEAKRLNGSIISNEEMELMLSGNFLRVCGLD